MSQSQATLNNKSDQMEMLIWNTDNNNSTARLEDPTNAANNLMKKSGTTTLTQEIMHTSRSSRHLSQNLNIMDEMLFKNDKIKISANKPKILKAKQEDVKTEYYTPKPRSIYLSSKLIRTHMSNDYNFNNTNIENSKVPLKTLSMRTGNIDIITHKSQRSVKHDSYPTQKNICPRYLYPKMTSLKNITNPGSYSRSK